jgi:hypothetical protein
MTFSQNPRLQFTLFISCRQYAHPRLAPDLVFLDLAPPHPAAHIAPTTPILAMFLHTATRLQTLPLVFVNPNHHFQGPRPPLVLAKTTLLPIVTCLLRTRPHARPPK